MWVTTSSLKCSLIVSFVLSFASLYQVVHSLKIIGLGVPSRILSGDRSQFSCHFALEGHTLQSLTWTKDDLPFFRYRYGDALEDEATNNSSGVEVPKSADLIAPEVHKITYEVPGITVDSHGSTLNVVSLSHVDHRATGSIGCRIRALHSNNSDKEKSDVTVIDPPKHAPEIQGMDPDIELEEMLHLNCTSPPAHPPVTLDWSINGQQAAEIFVTNFPGEPDGDGRTNTAIGLSLALHEENFLGDGVLRIRCSASILGDPGRVSEVILLEHEVRKTQPWWREEEDNENGGAGLVIGEASVLSMVLLAVHPTSQLLTLLGLSR